MKNIQLGVIPIWAMVCLFALSYIGENMYTVALPFIAEDLNISAGVIQKTTTSYFAGFACGILSLGRISDLYGRRRVVIFGITIYAFSAVVCMLLRNVELLIIVRFFMAFGASVGSVVGQAMARDSYQGDQLSYVYTKTSIWLALLPSLSAIIAGYILEFFSWPYIFIAISVIASLLTIAYIIFLPETNPYIGKSTNSYLKVLKKVITDYKVLLYALIIGNFNGICFGLLMELPFIFVNKIGIESKDYGLLAMLLGIAMAIGGLVSKRLIKAKWLGKKIMLLGLTTSLVATVLLVLSCSFFADINNKYLLIIIILSPMLLHMVGHGLAIPICLRNALEDYADCTGTAGSIFGAFYYMLVAIISFILSSLHDLYNFSFAIVFLVLGMLSYVAYFLINKK